MNFAENHLVQRIKERFCQPEFATLANVATPSGTFADAMAVNLWRSRGYEVVGFEVKSSRSDWLREKKDPKKAEGVAQYCNTFWIVANEGVVKLDELPLGWGLFEPYGKGLRCQQRAKTLEHQRTMSVALMVNLIRRAVEKGEMTEELNAAREAGRQAGIEEMQRRNISGVERELRDKLDRFTKLHTEFKERTGIEIGEWVGGKELSVAFEVSRRMSHTATSIGFARGTLQRQCKELDGILQDLKAHEV